MRALACTLTRAVKEHCKAVSFWLLSGVQVHDGAPEFLIMGWAKYKVGAKRRNFFGHPMFSVGHPKFGWPTANIGWPKICAFVTS